MSYCVTKNFTLTEEKLNELRTALKSESDSRLYKRLLILERLHAGLTATQLSKAFNVSDRTIRTYVKSYREGGLAGLLTLKHKGSKGFLTKKQQEELKVHIQSARYRSAKEIADYIKEKYGVKYASSTVSGLLKTWEFNLKKPKVASSDS